MSLDALAERAYGAVRMRNWLATTVGLSLAFASAAQAEPISVHGALIPSEAVKVGENRYRVPGDWEAVTKSFRKIYPEPQFRWRSIVNQPGVKAVHIPVPGAKSFEGINIYQANDEIRLFVVPWETKPKKAKK